MSRRAFRIAAQYAGSGRGVNRDSRGFADVWASAREASSIDVEATSSPLRPSRSFDPARPATIERVDPAAPEPQPPVEVASGLERTRADDVVVLLAAMGIPATRERTLDGRFAVLVDAADEARARDLVADEYPDGVDAPPRDEQPQPRREPAIPARDLWLGRGTWAVVLVVAACVAWFARLHGAGEPSRARLLAFGAITWDQVWVGEWWRLLSAVFVHFDGAHVTTNMITLLIVGPPLANLLGPWRFLLIFVLTGVAGNLASHLLAPTAGLKAGASGAVSGVLGALGGTSLDPGWGRRYARWQVIGALFAIYALLVGAAEQGDHVAHLGGLVSGIALGEMLTPPAPAVARTAPPDPDAAERGGAESES